MPQMPPCWHSSLSWVIQFHLLPVQVNFPMCTIAHTPRLPEHCVEYVRVLLWPQEKPFGGKSKRLSLFHSAWCHFWAVLSQIMWQSTEMTQNISSGSLRNPCRGQMSTASLASPTGWLKVGGFTPVHYDLDLMQVLWSYSFFDPQGVIKRIIPAVASTNAIIAAACATEVLKIASRWVPLFSY